VVIEQFAYTGVRAARAESEVRLQVAVPPASAYVMRRTKKPKSTTDQDGKTSVLAKVDVVVVNLLVEVDKRSWKVEEAGVAEGKFRL
jgi:hypothetical protein